jgi:hypothetical protein
VLHNTLRDGDLPFKDKKKAREYKRKYMRDYRKHRKQQKKQAKEELLKKFSPSQIKIELPTVHELVWGKPKPKK